MNLLNVAPSVHTLLELLAIGFPKDINLYFESQKRGLGEKFHLDNAPQTHYIGSMLTTNDLGKIQKIVQTEVIKAIQSDVNRKVIREESKVVVDEALKPVKITIQKIQKNQKTIVNFFDHNYLDLEKRVTKVEHHLQFPTVA